MILNKINIVKLEILFNIKKKLAKTCNLSNHSIAIFESLPIIIIMEDFDQFTFIVYHFF